MAPPGAPGAPADGIDVPDDVGDGHVRGGELFDEARVSLDPRYRRLIALTLDGLPAVGRDGAQRVVVNLRPGDDGYRVVEQVDELADDAALGLPAKTQKDEVVAREHGVDDLRDDRLVVADDAGEDALAAAQLPQEVGAHLVLHGARPVALLFQFAECLG